MTCRRARDLDLAAYLVDPEAPEWSAFRAHYPACPDCVSALASWTEIEEALREGGEAQRTSLHPDPALLAAFDGDPRSLPAERWQEIHRHLETCRRCSDELAALQSFDFRALAASAPARPVDALRELGRSLLEGGRALAARARAREESEPLLHPEPAVAIQAARETAPSPRPLAVLVALGELSGQVFPLFQGEARLGRGRECELRVEHDTLPRVAARIRTSPDTCEIESLPARPLLRVNGVQTERAQLRDGDRLQLGSEEFELRRVGVLP